MFLKVLVLCAFLSISEAVFHVHHGGHGSSHTPRHKTVVVYPPPKRQTYNEEEMGAYLQQKGNEFFQLGKRINAKAANICRWNYATLTDPQKRSCSCLAVFGFLNEGDGNPLSEAYSIFVKIWHEFSQQGGPNAACLRRDPNSPRQLHDVCLCMTGQSLV